MKIRIPSSFRARVFLALTFVSLIPTALALGAGFLVLREVVVSTGSAGAWDQVAESGTELFETLAQQGALTAEVAAAAERHEAALGESVRFSRLYAFLGERVLALLPLVAILLLLFIGALALMTANWLSRGFARPVEELLGWTRELATGAPLPPPRENVVRGEVREFAQLRSALRTTARELREARDRELQQARVRSWAEMARKVAHELKNPLTPMRMAAERAARAQEPAVAEAGEILREEIERLDEMARSFAQFGRPPEGPTSEVDLAELLTSLGRRLSVTGAAIVVDVPDVRVIVRGHLHALETVMRNLIANAQEATAAGKPVPEEAPPIEVSLRALEGTVEIRVVDRGTGIPEDVLPRIWEPEFTAKARGTGLGLPMVRQVVHAHGGEVTASNRPDGGAEFTVRLPREDAR